MNTFKGVAGITVAFIYLAVALGLTIGYVINVFHLIGNVYEETTHFVLGLAGVFVPPLGAIMGWMF